jgi:hypothetical protein
MMGPCPSQVSRRLTGSTAGLPGGLRRHISDSILATGWARYSAPTGSPHQACRPGGLGL